MDLRALLSAQPIRETDGVLEYVDHHDAGFSTRWQRHPKPQATTDGIFEMKTGWNLSSLAGKVVIDAGCGCGRTSMKLHEVAGRADHLRKIRGVLFTPVAVEELLRGEFPEVTEYEIVVQKKGAMDEISLRYETGAAPEDSASQGIRGRLLERLKAKTNLRFQLFPEKPGALKRYTLKAKRFKDLR